MVQIFQETPIGAGTVALLAATIVEDKEIKTLLTILGVSSIVVGIFTKQRPLETIDIVIPLP